MCGSIPIVKRKDEPAHGEYRTKRVILGIYDAMQQAMATGTPYRLDPPPTNGWTPPEVSEAVMGQQGDGAKENRAVHSSDAFQLRIETDTKLERDFSL